MTNVIKFPEMKRLQIEVLDWSFNNHDRSMDITYFKNGNAAELHLTREQLLKELDAGFLIDTYQGEEVAFTTVIDYNDGFEPDGHAQRQYSDKMHIVEFMNEVFGEEEVYRLVRYHEEQIETSRTARMYADKIQRTIKSFCS